MASNGTNGQIEPSADRLRARPHEEFLELAAVSTSGDLTGEEQQKLREHLALCADCRQAMKEFEAVVDVGVPLLSAELEQAPSPQTVTNPESTEAAGLGLVSARGTAHQETPQPAGQSTTVPISRRNGQMRTQVNWNLMWMPFAAAVLLTGALGIYTYRVGKDRGVEIARGVSPLPDSKLDALERQLSDAGHDHETLNARLTERERVIADLQKRVHSQSATLSELRTTQANLEGSLQTGEAEKQRALAEERQRLNQKLDVTEAALQKVQAELNMVRQQRSEDQSRSDSLEAQIRDLNGQLREREQAINKDEELLAHDRDIRDLMGARDLYIAEVYDVGRDGATQKPYGRVFYTKGKSLIFYAYDLDQQSGAKNATFQAWGRRGPDNQQALNLGILYKDSVGKKRWVLKFDDEKALEQIDAVFVTLEPNAQSHKPSGKSLLFAYLKVSANHP